MHTTTSAGTPIPFFSDYLVNYTNAATLVNEDFKDAEDLDGVFSGLMQGSAETEWPFNGLTEPLRPCPWRYASEDGFQASNRLTENSRWEDLVGSLRTAAGLRDDTLQHPRSVFQIVRRHFRRYTPEMVERLPGAPRRPSFKIAARSWKIQGATARRPGPTRSAGPSTPAVRRSSAAAPCCSCCSATSAAPGAASWPCAVTPRSRGQPTSPPSTTAFTGTCRRHRQSGTTGPCALTLTAETSPTGYWANLPKFLVSYLKSMYGAAATPENEFGYAWHPKISGDHSHLPMFMAMAEGHVNGMLCIGQNPATSLNASLERQGLRNLQWLVVKDNFMTETATFWYKAPEIVNGDGQAGGHPHRSLFLPLGPGRRNGGQLHQHPAHAAVARQSRGRAGRLPLGCAGSPTSWVCA